MMRCAFFALLLSGTQYAWSQQVNFAALEKLSSGTPAAVVERLYIHTDRELYVSGEIIWFKVYYTSPDSRRPAASAIAYIEVINANNEAVLQTKIHLDTGKGKGSFYLPPSLGTGKYIIRAYTNWMKNFDASYFFEKQITIVNTIRAAERPTTDSISEVLSFFPEGGDLIRGIKSRVGFMVSSKKGVIKTYLGYLLDQNNDTVATFQPGKFGLGHFSFSPVTGAAYRAFIVLPDGKKIQGNLPPIAEYGYAIVVSEEQQHVRVTVRNRKATQGVEQLMLAIHSREVLKQVEKGQINNDSLVFIVSKDRLGKGISYFTLFNSNGQPVAERLFFVKPSLNNVFNLKTDQGSYGSRQKIELSITQQGSVSSASRCDLSAAVFLNDSLSDKNAASIIEYTWLTSELPGIVESPSYYFSEDPGVAEATENLLLTYGWRKFRWATHPNENPALVNYPPELYGHLIQAQVKDPRTNLPEANAEVYLSIPGRPFGFYTARTDKNGLARFEIKNYHGNGQIIVQPGMNADSLLKVDVLSPFAEISNTKSREEFLVSEEMKESLLANSIAMQVQSIYAGDSLRVFETPFIKDTLPFYGVPETAYRLDDYQRFTTMEEVLREYVREVGVGLRNEKLIFKIFNPLAHDFYVGGSLVMLDGVPLVNPNKIFEYDPLKVKQLDVIRDRYFLGQSVFQGIASFRTYEGGFSAYELDPRLVAIDYGGLQLQRQFYSPVYETSQQLESRIPDFRNTLFWAPDIAAAKDKTSLQFYSSDNKGRYRVVVQGMKDGEPVFATTYFDVK